jgi:hypothetical protein
LRYRSFSKRSRTPVRHRTDANFKRAGFGAEIRVTLISTNAKLNVYLNESSTSAPPWDGMLGQHHKS